MTRHAGNCSSRTTGSAIVWRPPGLGGWSGRSRMGKSKLRRSTSTQPKNISGSWPPPNTEMTCVDFFLIIFAFFIIVFSAQLHVWYYLLLIFLDQKFSAPFPDLFFIRCILPEQQLGSVQDPTLHIPTQSALFISVSGVLALPCWAHKWFPSLLAAFVKVYVWPKHFF